MIVVYRRLRSAFETSCNLSQRFYYSAPKRLFELCPPFSKRIKVCAVVQVLFRTKICIRQFVFEMQLARTVDDDANAAHVFATANLEIALVAPIRASVHANDPVITESCVSSKASNDLRRVI